MGRPLRLPGSRLVAQFEAELAVGYHRTDQNFLILWLPPFRGLRDLVTEFTYIPDCLIGHIQVFPVPFDHDRLLALKFYHILYRLTQVFL